MGMQDFYHQPYGAALSAHSGSAGLKPCPDDRPSAEVAAACLEEAFKAVGKIGTPPYSPNVLPLRALYVRICIYIYTYIIDMNIYTHTHVRTCVWREIDGYKAFS